MYTLAIVIALRDFTVGPSHEVVIRKGQIRAVSLNELTTAFFTETDHGMAFGHCKLGNGWALAKRIRNSDVIHD